MSTALAKLDSLIEKLEAASEGCRETTRKAHEATQGLRDAIKDGRALIREIEQLAGRDAQQRIDVAVAEGLEQYAGTIREQMDRATDKVLSEFDRLACPLYETLGMIDLYTQARKRRGKVFCLSCGHQLSDSTSTVSGDASMPKAGDVSVCEGCGGLAKFTDDGRSIRALTAAEHEGAMSDPKVLRARAAVLRGDFG